MKRILGLCLILAFSSVAPVFARSPEFEPRACPEAAMAAAARCGVVHVPENHARPRGRKIALNVLLLPAVDGVHRKIAQYDLEGGPGFAATDFLEFYAGEGAIYRERRDIVLVDLRGTGASNPLRCAAIEEHERRQPTALLYSRDDVVQCAQQSQVASDPRQYTTAAASRDIEAVRRALGYEQFDLNAISYGTTLALRYIADYPARVHSAVLMGTVPESRTPPRFHAPAAQAAFEKLATECAADPACQRTYGDLHTLLRTALEHAPAQSMPPAVFLEKLRNRLYAPATRVGVPLLLSRAAQGDFSDFTRAGRSGRTFADGLYLSITCAESFGRMNVAEAIGASNATTFGAYRLERQSEACKHWPVVAAPPARDRTSAVPVLFIAGELDPVSPAEWAQETVARFPQATLVLVPRGAHVLDGLTALDTCLDATILAFFAAGTAKGLDTSCFATMTPPAFEGAP
jgi:pimeloyl-ACP methyl ester carboxylesterase